MARLPTRPFNSSAAGFAVKSQVISLLESGKITLQPGLPRLFVCGGTTTPLQSSPLSQRSAFLKWVKRQKLSVEILLAEDMYPLARTESDSFLNLGLFEQIIADLADCVLIFCESAGSFAELGLFSNTKKLRTKTFVSLEQKHHGADSFLALGPISAIQRDSIFGTFPTLLPGIRNRTKNFAAIRDKLIPHLQGQKKARVLILKAAKPDDLQEQLSLVLLVIKIVGVITFGDLIDIIRDNMFGLRSNNELHSKLVILLYFEQVRKVADNVYVFKDDSKFPIKLDNAQGNIISVTAYCRQFYQKNFPTLLSATAEAE
jgi:hypothetical protein